MTAHTWDSIIIGGGGAGLSAAQALGRSLRRTLVLDAGAPRNHFAAHMHNVLGHDGAPPRELYARGRREAENYGVEFLDASVNAVAESDDGLLVRLSDAQELRAKTLVVATGTSDELPAIPGLAEHWGSSVLHCPYCHGWEVRGKRLAVLATSPLSAHQAKLLRQWSDRLTVFTDGLRDADGRVDEDLQRALAARGIRTVDAPVVEVIGDGAGIREVITADGDSHSIDAIFTGGRLIPHDGFLDGLELDRATSPVGSFISVDGMQRTSHPRIWAAGNVVTPMATVPLAMGAGSIAGAAVNFALVEREFADALGE